MGSRPWKLCGPSLEGPLTVGALPPTGTRAALSGGPVTGNGTLGYLRLAADVGMEPQCFRSLVLLFL